jgi:hypothetical protein
MFPLSTVATATSAINGVPLAVTIAVAVTALVAVGMMIVGLRRTHRLTGLTAGIGAASVLAILVGALFVGGSLTRPSAANADEDHGTRSVGSAPIEAKLTGLQLPTLALPE